MKMNKLKNIIRLFSIAIVLSTTFFVSCSESEDLQDVIGQEKEISLSIIASPSTRSVDEVSAIGVIPIVKDAIIYFISNSTVVHYERVYAGESGSISRQMTFKIPQNSDRVIVFGNQSTTLSSDRVFAIGTSVDDLMKFQVSLERHYNLSPSSVFVYGESNIRLASKGSLSADVIVLPSLSRIEISSVESLLRAKHYVSAYTLSGVYINNTYESLGLDQRTTTGELSGIINYDRTSNVWKSSYPAPFHDIVTNVARSGMKVSPPAPYKLWSYYIHPLKDNAPTIDGQKQGLVPHIVLKFNNVQIDGKSGVVEEAYLTISGFINASTQEAITSFDRGKVYSISSISFGGENLSFSPGSAPDVIVDSTDPNPPVVPPIVTPPVTPPTPVNTVTVVVTDWISSPIDTELK